MPKILIFDLETAPMLVTSWGLFKQDHNIQDIIQDWFIICASWKWADKKKVHHSSVLDSPNFSKDCTDDKVICEKLHELILEADFLAGHNIKAFDWKKLNTRFIFHGLTPLPKPRMLDTLEIAKREFKFSSNKLDYIAKFIGGEGKRETPKGLWQEAMFGNKKAIKEMIKYCDQDILVSEDVLNYLQPYNTMSPNMSTVDDTEHTNCSCPKCSSEDLTKRGFARTASGKFQRYQCNNCGGWSRGRENLLSKKYTGKTIAQQFLTSQ